MSIGRYGPSTLEGSFSLAGVDIGVDNRIITKYRVIPPVHRRRKGIESMTRMRALFAITLLLCTHAPSEAQGFFPPFAPVNPWFGGIRFGYSGRNFGVAGSLGFPAYYWGNPWFNPYWGAPYYPWGVRNVSIVYSPPPIIASPPIVINQPIVVLPDRRNDWGDDGEFVRIVPRRQRPVIGADKIEPPPPEAEKPMPGEDRGRFRPIRPVERNELRKEAPAAKPPPEVADINRGRSEKFIDAGKAVFLMQQFGRAERFFQSATEAKPVEPVAFFLLAEALLARAKYQEATVAIFQGLQFRPDWPTSQFRPIDLYGNNQADFRDHRQRLDETLARNPNDKDLLFLAAYEKWFSGEMKEALQLFHRAVAAGANANAINLFLKARPAIPIVRK